MNRERIIFHCDCDAFFASVECIDRPELRSVPMAVAGNPENRHGIILAKNQLAKNYGVKTAETVWKAREKCPHLILIPAHNERYVETSRKVNAIYAEYTDLLEPFGIDETFLDVTNSLHLFYDTPAELAEEIRRRIREEIKITVSIGISFQKAFAKLGSDYNKPDGQIVITRENYKEILYPLPVSDLMYAGPKMTEKLKSCGIYTIGQAAELNREALEAMLGKQGVYLWSVIQGKGNTEVTPDGAREKAKSVGHGMTFHRNLIGEADMFVGIALLADRVAERLQKKNLLCSGVQLTIRSPEFQNMNRQMQLGHKTQLFGDIYTAACQLLKKHWDMENPIRLLSVTGIGISEAEETNAQISFFDAEEQQKKREKIEAAVHAVRGKYGPGAVFPGAIIGTNLLQEENEKKKKPDMWDVSGYRPFHGVEGL